MNVFVVDDEPLIRMDIREMLKDSKINVVGEASDGFDAIEGVKRLEPDLVLLDVKMPILDGLKAAEIIKKNGYKGCIVMLTAYNSEEFIERANKTGVMGYFVKPIDERNFIPNLKIIYSRHKEIIGYQKEIKEANIKLEERKKIEKAKGLLMKNKNISENEAYNYLRKISMDKRLSLFQVAEIILFSEVE